MLAVPAPATAMAQSTLRIAVFHTGLGRSGPGLLLRDIGRAEPDVILALDAIVRAAPDVILLLDIDWDYPGATVAAFAAALADAGYPMPHGLSPRPNSGMHTGQDLDGDGRLGTADDAQGWGRFAGSGGMALLSRFPLAATGLIDHSAFLWRDLPHARLPRRDGHLFPSAAVFEIQRLASVGAWEVPVLIDGAPLTIMAYHAGPPVFGGAANRNFNRNADETAFWLHRLDGALNAASGGALPPHFVLIGDANLDPSGGDGDHAVMRALLAHPLLQDPAPTDPQPPHGGPDTATAHWPDGPGALRVDYVLPSAAMRVQDAGLIWPSPDATHALVWVDIAWPP